MTLELTEQQRQQVTEHGGGPVEVVDPVSRRGYVLIAKEQYERVRAVLEAAAPAPPAEAAPAVSPLMLRSQQAYWRELPELLKDGKLHRQRVCYHGDQRIGTARTDAELVRRCLRLGLQRGDFYIGWIEERPTPPWEPPDVEESLFDVTD